MKGFVGAVFSMALMAMAGVYAIAHRHDLQRTVTGLSEIATQPSPLGERGAEATLGEVVEEPTTEKSNNPYDVTLTANDQGHFETEAEINGRSVDVMVDTGATIVALTYEDAERAGIFLKSSDFTGVVSTANGAAKVALVTIGTVSIGPITVRNVRGAVTESGKLQKTLLGMSFLSRLSRVDMRSKNLVLQE